MKEKWFKKGFYRGYLESLQKIYSFIDRVDNNHFLGDDKMYNLYLKNNSFEKTLKVWLIKLLHQKQELKQFLKKYFENVLQLDDTSVKQIEESPF